MKKKDMPVVLIVEDEMNIVEALETKLQESGFAVLVARDGRAGLKATQKNIPDIILLDIIMPIMDGITMLEHIMADKKTANIPVIMLTNLSDAHSLTAAKEKGVYDYLVKAEWSIDDVITKVKQTLKNT